ncbi:sigma-54 interaction domain-containing protein [Guptibacillus sedimenti]|uniref:sigma-54 interaction domain-containing protein n=1 Tax=Guptibacillus sedimenti TaxID=3025680 RepID=UPI00308115CE
MLSIMKTAGWEEIFSSLHNGIVMVDHNERIRYMNKSAQSLLRIHNWEGADVQKIVPNTRVKEVLESGHSLIGERLELFDRECVVNRTPLYKNEELVGVISVIQDITEVKHYRDLLRQFESIIEFSTDGLYVVDQEGVTIYVNSAYEEITGFQRSQLIGRHMNELIDGGYIDQSVSLLVLKEKKRISLLQKISDKKDVIVTGSPVFNENHEIELVVTSVRDITQLNSLRSELDRARTFSALNQNRYSLQVEGISEKIIFRSKEMYEIYEKVKRIAPYPTSILLSGESGVGKEVVANLIHYESDRKDMAFIKVNCGAIPEHLLESELFGYESGAFTGARKDGKFGLLELAQGGTVMLDEVGEMPLSLQVKMLRVLQDGEFYRIGGSQPIKLDIRIISATNKKLLEEIQNGSFREDLYYRLQVIEILIPPLGKRVPDIEVLVDHYFSYYCTKYHIEKRLTKETHLALLAYSWPGNVRELKNMIENLVVSVPAISIEPHHLPVHITDSRIKGSEPLTLKERVENFEKRIIKDALQKHPSIRSAAKELGIDHSTLVKKMKKW